MPRRWTWTATPSPKVQTRRRARHPMIPVERTGVEGDHEQGADGYASTGRTEEVFQKWGAHRWNVATLRCGEDWAPPLLLFHLPQDGPSGPGQPSPYTRHSTTQERFPKGDKQQELDSTDPPRRTQS